MNAKAEEKFIGVDEALENCEFWPDDDSGEHEDELIELTKISMVITAFEKDITTYVISISENHEFDITSGAIKKAENQFVENYHRLPKNFEDLVRSTTLPLLINIAQQITENHKQKENFARLSEIFNALQIAQTRNKSYHANNVYNPVYWIRVQALAMDPVIGKLKLTRVIERCKAARKGELERIDIILQQQITTIPNNLPEKDYQELFGRESVQKEIRDSLLNPRKASISIYGAGGLGKTACVLDVLSDLSTSEAGPEHFDYILYSTLKSEFLVENRISMVSIGQRLEDIKNQFAIGINNICGRINTDLINLDSYWSSIVDEFGKKRIVLWVDNLETLQENLHEAFSSFEETLPKDWKLIVTSRIRTRSASSIISLSPLDQKSAAKLMQNEYKIGTGQRIDFSTAEIRALELFCNPLAIKNTVAYLKLTGKSLMESIEVAKDAIISFSYERVAESLQSDCKSFVELLFCTDGLTKYQASKIMGLEIDAIIEYKTLLMDLGLLATTSNEELKLNLNSNFRSYLQLHPIGKADRNNYMKYIEDKNFDSDIPVNTLNSNHSNPLRFSYIGTLAASNPVLSERLQEGIGVIGRAYKIQDDRSSYNETEIEVSDDALRNLCTELKSTKEMILAEEECPPDVDRLLGLIYEYFNVDKEANFYFELGAKNGDLVCLRNLFTRNHRKKQYKKSLIYCQRLFSSIPILLDNDDYIKLLTQYHSSLDNYNKQFGFDISKCHDFLQTTINGINRKPSNKAQIHLYRADIFSKLAFAISKKRDPIDTMGIIKMKESCEYLKEAYSSIELTAALGFSSRFYTNTIRRTLNASIHVIATHGYLNIKVPRFLVSETVMAFENNNNIYTEWRESMMQRDTWDKGNQCFYDLCVAQLRDLSDLLNNTSLDNIDITLNLPWFKTKLLTLKYIGKSGFDDKFALFLDPRTNNEYYLNTYIFNKSGYPKINFRWDNFVDGFSYPCLVYERYYFMKYHNGASSHHRDGRSAVLMFSP